VRLNVEALQFIKSYFFYYNAHKN